MRPSLLTFCLAALIALTSVNAAAQTAAGTVVDGESGTPVPGAAVSLVQDGEAIASVLTDSTGTFSIRVVRAGDYTLRIAAIGFEPEELDIELKSLEVVNIRVVLGPRPVGLEPIEVVTRARRGSGTALEAFHERKYWMGDQLGLGHFYDEERIEELNPMGVTDLLKTIPGVRLIAANVHGTYDIRLTGSSTCSPKIYVDGVWWNRWSQREESTGGISLSNISGSDARPADRNDDIDKLLSPFALAGVEVYRRGSELPAEFADGEGRGFRCGVIALWTKRGR